MFWTVTALSFAIGFLLIIPIGGADMPVVISDAQRLFRVGGGGGGFHARQQRHDYYRRPGRSGAILSYIMCRAMNRSFISVIAGGFGAVESSGDAAPSIAPTSAARPRTPPS